MLTRSKAEVLKKHTPQQKLPEGCATRPVLGKKAKAGIKKESFTEVNFQSRELNQEM